MPASIVSNRGVPKFFTPQGYYSPYYAYHASFFPTRNSIDKNKPFIRFQLAGYDLVYIAISIGMVIGLSIFTLFSQTGLSPMMALLGSLTFILAFSVMLLIFILLLLARSRPIPPFYPIQKIHNHGEFHSSFSAAYQDDDGNDNDENINDNRNYDANDNDDNIKDKNGNNHKIHNNSTNKNSITIVKNDNDDGNDQNNIHSNSVNNISNSKTNFYDDHFNIHDNNKKTYPFTVTDIENIKGYRIIYPNDPTPIQINTPMFKGIAILKVRTDPQDGYDNHYSSYFKKHPKIQISLQVQGKFKKSNLGRLFVAFEVPNLRSQKDLSVASINIERLAKTVASKGAHYCTRKKGKGNDEEIPHIAYPITQTIDIITTNPGEVPPKFDGFTDFYGCAEPKKSVSRKKMSTIATPLGMHHRKVEPFDKCFNTNATYSFSFTTDTVNLMRWEINAGHKRTSLGKIVEDQKIRLVAYELERPYNSNTKHISRIKKYYFCFLVHFTKGKISR